MWRNLSLKRYNLCLGCEERTISIFMENGHYHCSVCGLQVTETHELLIEKVSAEKSRESEEAEVPFGAPFMGS